MFKMLNTDTKRDVKDALARSVSRGWDNHGAATGVDTSRNSSTWRKNNSTIGSNHQEMGASATGPATPPISKKRLGAGKTLTNSEPSTGGGRHECPIISHRLKEAMFCGAAAPVHAVAALPG